MTDCIMCKSPAEKRMTWLNDAGAATHPKDFGNGERRCHYQDVSTLRSLQDSIAFSALPTSA